MGTFIQAPIDTLKPVISSNITDFILNTDRDQPYATASWITPTAIDNSGSVTLSSDYNSGNVFLIGTTDVTYTATDPSGNSAIFTFTITVKGKLLLPSPQPLPPPKQTLSKILKGF